MKIQTSFSLGCTCVIFLIFLLGNTLNAQHSVNNLAPNPHRFQIGEVREIQSAELSETRVLNIYLPENYGKDPAARYPVIYLLDGSANEDFIHIVGLVQFFCLQFNMPETIVIGIANVDRKRDFTSPTTDKELLEAFPTTGGSAKFISFLEKELQPFIETNYPVNDSKTLIGQSLGGLLASEVLLKKPELFNRYLIVSPSLWWDNESLLKAAPQLLQAQKDERMQVYISVGSEGKVMKRVAGKLKRDLAQSGKKNLQLFFMPRPKENHATILHNSIYQAFLIFFPYQEPEK